MKLTGYLILMAAALLVISCAAKNKIEISTTVTPIKPQTVTQVSPIGTTLPIDDLQIPAPAFEISSISYDAKPAGTASPILNGVLKEFDIPLTDTPRVQYYLNYYTGNGRNIMQRWLDRSGKYMHIVCDTFEREGVPRDLAMLAFTESGFNPNARSVAGAVGMWQFMPSTGSMYGLHANDWVDERMDFEKATLAAAKHLKDLHNAFGDWYLALAAYNAGSGRIRSATIKHKSTDFFTIASTRTLKLETRDYVPKYLAQLIIYKNMLDHGFTSPSELPLLYDSIEVKEQVNIITLADALGCTTEELKELNPELRTFITPPVRNYTIRIPRDTYDIANAFISDPNSDKMRYTVYKARSGELIAKIAANHRVNIKDIQQLNSFPYSKVYTDKILFIPQPGCKLDDYDMAFAKDIARLAPKYYTVKKGDNLTTISRQYNIPLTALISLNPNVNPKRIYPGQVLVISQGGLVS